MDEKDPNPYGVPREPDQTPASPPVFLADSLIARLMGRLLPADRRARYEAALREADARLGGNPEALDLSQTGEFAAQVMAQTPPQTPPAEPATTSEDPAFAWLEGLAAKQSARPPQAAAIPRTPAPAQSPAHFPVVSPEPPSNRRWLSLALALLIGLAAGGVIALMLLSQVGAR